ncbi:MAG: thioredoxin family protein [Sporichthyaceae bacterium]
MAVTSQMVPLGTPAPDFTLPAIDGSTVSLADLAGAPALLVVFLCAHCPYVKHVEDTLGPLAAELVAAGAAVVGICSNDVERYPDDDVPGLQAQAAKAGFVFPYLVDADQSVALAYRAACTPDFFLYDAARTLAWRGQYDDSRPSNGVAATGSSLREAVELVLAGKPVPEPHTPGMGCGIKWKPGNEPL